MGALDGGRFTEYPIHEGGSCIDLSAVPAGAQITAGAGGDEPTVVHGLAGPTVRTIEVTTPTRQFDVPIGPRGGFVAVLEPGTAIAEVHVTAVFEDGDRRRLL